MRIEFKETFREIGANISYYRRKAEFTQEYLAEKVKIEQPHLSHIEVGSAAASLDVMIAISKELNVPLHKFFEFRE